MSRRILTMLAVAALAIASLAQAAVVSGAGPTELSAKLTGSHEVAPVQTDGTGYAHIIIVGEGSSIYYQVVYSGLSGPVTGAHIHAGGIGTNGPVLLPLAAGPSPMEGTLTSANFTGANGLTYAQALDAIRSGGAYVNVHTAANPGGELRGQLYDDSVPQRYVISADAPEAVPAGRLWAYNDYFPRTLTVARGAVVSFAIKGFHTGTILPAGMTAAQDFTSGGSIAYDTDDTVRNPNGTTRAGFNLGALFPVLPTATCGSEADPCSFDGTQIVSEGAPLGPPTAPAAIRIDAPNGTYVFHCRVHPAMNATLTVASPGAAVASPDDVAAATAQQIKADTAAAEATMAAANKAGRVKHANGTSTWILRVGAETPDHHVDILEMLPSTVTIAPGDKVLWRSSGRNEPHTVTFPKDLGTDTVAVCRGSDGSVVECQGPPDELLFGGGNGVRNITSPTTESDSGLIMPAVTSIGYGVRPSAALTSWRVSFKGAEAGTYTYVCQIHDGMAGVIVVAGT